MIICGPCFNCSDRILGCHAYCFKYADYKMQRDKIIQQKIKAEKGYLPKHKPCKGSRKDNILHTHRYR